MSVDVRIFLKVIVTVTATSSMSVVYVADQVFQKAIVTVTATN
jgi:hypothetical protein